MISNNLNLDNSRLPGYVKMQESYNITTLIDITVDKGKNIKATKGSYSEEVLRHGVLNIFMQKALCLANLAYLRCMLLIVVGVSRLLINLIQKENLQKFGHQSVQKALVKR